MKIKTTLIILLLTPFIISAMVPEQGSKTLIELMPRELHQELMKYLLAAPGKDDEEKMVNAANNIRQFIKAYQLDKNIVPILEELVRKYPLRGVKEYYRQILAAALLATPNAIKWLSEQPEIERWTAATVSPRFPKILPYVIAIDTLREARSPSDRSLLFNFIANGKLDSIKMAIEAGTDINARDINGITPLLMVYGRPDIAQYLIDHGADVMNIDLSKLPDRNFANRDVEQVILKARDEQSKKASFYEYEYQR